MSHNELDQHKIIDAALYALRMLAEIGEEIHETAPGSPLDKKTTDAAFEAVRRLGEAMPPDLRKSIQEMVDDEYRDAETRNQQN